METPTITGMDLLFEENVKLLDFIEYGYGLQDLVEGKVKAFVGDECEEASAGSLVLVPEMVPDDLLNIGNSTAKVLGVFGGANNIVATFEQAILPTGSNVVDTAKVLS
jgi:hypothetical protein